MCGQKNVEMDGLKSENSYIKVMIDYIGEFIYFVDKFFVIYFVDKL